jgi:hypothetical protein
VLAAAQLLCLKAKSSAAMTKFPFIHSHVGQVILAFLVCQGQQVGDGILGLLRVLLTLTDQERQNYLSHMTMDEWEDCGDQMIERFTS